eukprot:TRINITY_DN32_c0_g1_i1.p1 TRINITY_DN32_c0_g1~~TRINITY_DN32_c0_g1_i1.p1  ORF type:complete len:336 (+),score=17.15 TRINITY_DN32_c0_g1_i1:167-1174(+)
MEEQEAGLSGVTMRGFETKRCLLASNSTEQKLDGRWRLIIAIVLCLTFMVAEIVGGLLAHSLAILSDAAHLLSDVLAFGISLFAGLYALRSSKETHSFGNHRIEILGSMVSVLIIWVVTGVLVYEAINRVITPETVNGELIIFIALGGLGFNIINLLVLGHQHNHADSAGSPEHTAEHGRKRSLGMTGAYIHVLGDAVQSIGVVIAGIIIWVKPAWKLADPICTFVFAAMVLFTTKPMVLEIVDIVMERVPRGLDMVTIKEGLQRIEGIQNIHDLHVWAVKPGMLLLAVHMEISNSSTGDQILKEVNAFCSSLGIPHTTIQMNTAGKACPCSQED